MERNNCINEESLKRLNEVNRARDEEMNHDMMKAIEKQVNTYLSTITKREDREQLSKPQLINSHKKTWDWLSKVKQNDTPSPVPEEFMKQDYDPILYDPNNPITQPPTPLIHPGSSKLSGEDFTTNVLPNCSLSEVENEVKQIRMKDWLLERQAKLIERDKLRQWMRENGYDDANFEKHVTQWQSLHPHRNVQQWTEIYKLKSNHLLSTNDLLRLYKSEVPSASHHVTSHGKHQGRWDRNPNNQYKRDNSNNNNNNSNNNTNNTT